MSLYGALLAGVAGLSAQSEALSVSSANIANVDTVGYKASQTAFATVLASSMGSGSSEAGVSATAVQNVTQAGILASASSPTDLAISGNGFFVTAQSLSDTANQFYTQDGDFSPDSNGNLVNSSGYYLLGYPVTTAGGVSTTSNTLSPVNVSALSGQAEPTTAITLQANLQSTSTVDSTYNPGDMAAGNVSPDFSRTVDVYDSQGGSQPLTFNFVETGANTWAYEVNYAGNASNITSTNPISEGTMTFNSDGTLANINGASPASGDLSLTIPWSASSGLASQTITVDMGTVGSSNGMTQFDSASTLTAATPNGASVGTLTGVSVGTNGDVTAQYSNGLSSVIYQVPLATFANEDGLTAVSGTAYQSSNASGSALLNTAGTGAAGTIKSSELEDSTVDINTEFTNLITSQNAYSAAARIITTADQMLQTLDQIPAT
ncbi:MAG TPA: flagellar hook protein FlgE [Rhizomicrobium sp.]|nr:flagellar hook protein FlgE [Rhizomicrobium sp.]